MENENPVQDQQQPAPAIDREELIDDGSTTSVNTEEVQAVATTAPEQAAEETVAQSTKGTFPRSKNEEARRRFAEWLATPKKDRSPATQGEFALENGVHPSTVSIWKHDPEFYDEYVARVKRDIGYRAVDILHAVADAAETEADTEAMGALLGAIDWKKSQPPAAPNVNLTLNQLIAQTEGSQQLPAWHEKTMEIEEVE